MSDELKLRRNWRTNWLSSIQEFADAETQRRLWLDQTNTNPHFSFVECLSCYFDDLGLSEEGYASAIDEGLVSKAEADALAEFHALADAYATPTNEYDHPAILADPEWDQVVAAARRAQSALLRLIDDPQERRFLLEP